MSEKWNQLPQFGSLPIARWGHATVVLNDKLYLMGGYKDGAYMNDFWEYDFTQWTQIKFDGIIPEPRSNHSLFVYENSIYLYGGGGSNKNRFGDVWQLNLDQKCWKKFNQQPDAPKPRTYHASCLGDNQMFIFGGEYGQDLDDLCIFDLETQKWKQIHLKSNQAPQARRFASLEYSNNKVYLIGGCLPSYKPISDIYVGNILCNEIDRVEIKWMKLTVQFERWGHSSILYNNSIWIYGGRNSQDMNDLVEINLEDFSITTQIMANSIKTRRKHSASLLGNSMIIFGGFNGEYHQDLHFVELENNLLFCKELETKYSVQGAILVDQELTDIEFIFEDQEETQKFQAHKYILIPQMKHLKVDYRWLEQLIKDTQQIILPKGIQAKHFDKFLTYIYTHRLTCSSPEEYNEFKKSMSHLVQEFDDQLFIQCDVEFGYHENIIAKCDQFNMCSTSQKKNIKTPFAIYFENEQYAWMIQNFQQTQCEDECSNFVYKLGNSDYYDGIVVTSDDIPFYLNKAQLSAQSGYFKALFQCFYSEKKDHVFTLKNIESTYFVTIYLYIYTSHLILPNDIDSDDLFQFIHIAMFLDMQDLKNKFELVIKSRTDQGNLFEIFQRSIECQNTSLQEYCSIMATKWEASLKFQPLNDKTNKNTNPSVPNWIQNAMNELVEKQTCLRRLPLNIINKSIHKTSITKRFI